MDDWTQRFANMATQASDAERERDELRAEVERLWAELSKSHGFLEIQQARTERDELRADLDGLMQESRSSREAMDRARFKIDELRAELEQANALTRVWKATAEQSSAENERLRAALSQILEDPEARILDSHRDEGWEALTKPNGS